MESMIIQDSEVRALKVSSLPTRPTAKEAFGGSGYNAEEMKAAFDKFPEFILEKLNLLIKDLSEIGEKSYIGTFKTGTFENLTLQNLIDSIPSGKFAELLRFNGKSLAEWISWFEREITDLKFSGGGIR